LLLKLIIKKHTATNALRNPLEVHVSVNANQDIQTVDYSATYMI